MTGNSPRIESVAVGAYEIPTDQPEADGTLVWGSTTLVLVQVEAGGETGLGWTYAGSSSAHLVSGTLASICTGKDPFDVPGLNEEMIRACRNLGGTGVVACAISAVDTALWDLKARLLEVSLTHLFGQVRRDVPIYGSGGFTTYDDATTRAELERWVGEWDIPRVKIKVGESWGSAWQRDLDRVALARQVVGAEVGLFVDVNGGYSRKQAIRMGRRYVGESAVTWYEEPVSSDDLDGLREVRDNCDADVAAGEYGYTVDYFERMTGSGAVDCLQIDVTRCGGYTAWLRGAAVAGAHNLQVSGHCAPSLHAQVATAVPNLRHVEYFHDHYRIETMLFEGTLSPKGGQLTPDPDRVGHGLTFRHADAERFRIR